MNILVTGGAGYIGSHVVKQLGQAGHEITVLDDLSRGFEQAVLYGDLIVGSSGDRELVEQILTDRDIEAVMHFAASTLVPESVKNPLKYYDNNTCNTRNLIECSDTAGVKYFIFSSTATLYGNLAISGKLNEDALVSPINPYGTSKLMSEWMLRDYCAVNNMNYVTLRYFNVAGADVDGEIGQSTPESTLLIKVACEVATGKRPQLNIFGTDYPTDDGTGIRDYIHVSDLANAHLKALEYLVSGGESVLCNCGYGHGYSVREVINAVNTLLDKPLSTVEAPRREGDPAYLVADIDKISSIMSWEPHFDDINLIVKTALEWETNKRF